MKNHLRAVAAGLGLPYELVSGDLEGVKQVNTPAAGRFPIGVAVEAAGNGVTSVAVRLDGVATAAA
ncbi:hypothetical protein ACVDG3_20385 [Meridianimarinicoccus sp. RP-17]